MASGFGYTGGRSRCFVFWQEFAKCYAQTDDPAACRPQSEDYLECLHHKKEFERAKAVQDEFIRKAEAQAREGQKAADLVANGVIVGLGLIQRTKEEEAAPK
ncbi:putative NADH dehydrogenase (ubiquinone) Fe-S protein 5 [Lyophyllum shimeji]|uniref:NADH dehydrogenase [ubiquinone] iron-sulfur protein 5 n=1 Tax=Lyophyllum shimeji TaxID=47721 RepID=A0A9P3PSU8_LYOSH|nr:putative NADH dehydrogenase (ubiquinone) Fe-S protein 5 [Lyophyllum shimeji]